MSDLAIVFLLCGAALAGISGLLFCFGCDISLSVREDYGSLDDPDYLNLQEQKKATRIIIASYAFLLAGAIAFCVHFFLFGRGL